MLRRTQSSSPLALGRPHKASPLLGFDPAIADCGLQGTATSPSSTTKTNKIFLRLRIKKTVFSGNNPASCPNFLQLKWRRERDLNPRYRSYPYTRFPGVHLQPLGHLSRANFKTQILLYNIISLFASINVYHFYWF